MLAEGISGNPAETLQTDPKYTDPDYTRSGEVDLCILPACQAPVGQGRRMMALTLKK